MLNTNGFITKIRDIIIADTTFISAFTPDLPQDGDNLCAVTLLAGNSTNNLCNTTEYSTLTFRVLIRGSASDTNTRILADEVYNALHLKRNVSFTNGNIINIVATSTPVFVERDETQRILYNITFKANVE